MATDERNDPLDTEKVPSSQTMKTNYECEDKKKWKENLPATKTEMCIENIIIRHLLIRIHIRIMNNIIFFV